MDFCIQSRQSTRESLAIVNACRSLGYRFEFSAVAEKGKVPVGSVEFCETAANPTPPIINFFPRFLRPHLNRQVDLVAVLGNIPQRQEVFVKRADVWKSDSNARIFSPTEPVPPGNYYISEPVRFVAEWRYYVAHGTLLAAGWYDGLIEDESAPTIDVQWPSDFSGAVDFGRLEDGRIALVEAHAPFACGWYGDDPETYTYWQHEAWCQFIEAPNKYWAA